LIDILKKQVLSEGRVQLTLHCSPYYSNSALYPVINYFQRLCAWQASDDNDSRISKLQSMLKRYSADSEETTILMASLLSLEIPAREQSETVLSPHQQKQRTVDMIIAMMIDMAEQGPVLILWEDLHWADHSTLVLMNSLIEQVPTVSMLIVTTSRPGFDPPWPNQDYITPVTLNRLEQIHTQKLVNKIASAKALPEEVINHIVVKPDGVPLYVEELTKTILKSNILLDNGDNYQPTGPLDSLSIPDTLQEALVSRLDRLPQVRELAQIGAVFG
jgi:predicted ATPase